MRISPTESANRKPQRHGKAIPVDTSVVIQLRQRQDVRHDLLDIGCALADLDRQGIWHLAPRIGLQSRDELGMRQPGVLDVWAWQRPGFPRTDTKMPLKIGANSGGLEPQRAIDASSFDDGNRAVPERAGKLGEPRELLQHAFIDRLQFQDHFVAVGDGGVRGAEHRRRIRRKRGFPACFALFQLPRWALIRRRRIDRRFCASPR